MSLAYYGEVIYYIQYLVCIHYLQFLLSHNLSHIHTEYLNKKEFINLSKLLFKYIDKKLLMN